MFSCEKTEKLIDRWSVGEISKEEFSLVDKHMKECKSCKLYFEKAEALQKSFSAYKPEENSCPNYVLDNLADEIEKRAKPERALFFMSGRSLASVAAACFVVVALITIYYSAEWKKEYDPVVIARSEVPRNRPVSITVEYNAARDIKDAYFTIDLDSGLRFSSENRDIRSLKTHSWRGSLKKGLNKIPFVVDVKKNGVWNINTRADFEGYSHAHRIVLTAENEKVVIAYLMLPDTKTERY